MKKTLIIAILALFPLTSLAFFPENLKYSSSGPAVIELQEFLTSHSYYTGPITGYFYSLTLAGVKVYQAANGLPTTGYFGPMSRAKAQIIIESETASSTEQEIVETGTTTAPVVAPLETPSTAPVYNPPQPQTFGATIPVMPIDKSEIVVVQSKGNVSSDFPHGQIIFTVTVTDTEGKPNASTVDSVGNLDKTVSVTMTVPDTFNDKNLNDTRITNPFGQAVFGYIPKTTGTKDIIFTSGNLTKQITINVE